MNVAVRVIQRSYSPACLAMQSAVKKKLNFSVRAEFVIFVRKNPATDCLEELRSDPVVNPQLLGFLFSGIKMLVDRLRPLDLYQ